MLERITRYQREGRDRQSDWRTSLIEDRVDRRKEEVRNNLNASFESNLRFFRHVGSYARQVFG